MINVLFVCLGNICRSPLAEAVFVSKANELGLSQNFRCDSAGTHDYHKGSLPDKRSIQVAKNNGINLTHKARKVVLDDYHTFDYFFVMDPSVMRFLDQQKPLDAKAKLLYMRSFDPGAADSLEVPDPYYGEFSHFEEVYEMVEAASINLLNLYKNKLTW